MEGNFEHMIPLFTVIGILFFLVLCFSFVLFVFTVVLALSEKKQNDREPRLTVPAVVVAKRNDLYRYRSTSGGSTVYFVTFQVQSGDRLELNLSGREFGLLREGDRGSLTFRGKEFLDFTRER